MPHQSYETINWTDEAHRVQRAFGVTAICEFLERGIFASRFSLRCANAYHAYINQTDWVEVDYSSKRRSFRLVRVSLRKTSHTSLTLGWSGELVSVSEELSLSTPLAKALFHLDLLTPEVEQALNISISAHQKTEWTLEYAGRVGR